MRWEVRTSSGTFLCLRYSWLAASRAASEFQNRWWARLVILPVDWPEWSVERIWREAGPHDQIGPWSG